MSKLGDLKLQCQHTFGPGVKAIEEAATPKPDSGGVKAVANVCDMFKGHLPADGLPPPGSKEFCDAAPFIVGVFEHIGDGVVSTLAQFTPDKLIRNWGRLKTSSGNSGTVAGVIVNFWNSLVDAVASVANSIVDPLMSFVADVVAMQNCFTARCNPKAIFGVWIVQQYLRFFDNVEIGWDIAVWATVNITVDFPKVRRWLELINEYLCPMELPSPELATRAWLLNRITQTQRDCIWRLHGIDPATYAPFADTEREQLEWQEAIQYYRRIKAPEDMEDRALRARGFTTAVDVAMAKEMFWELPTIADHLHWLQRNVFDAQYVADYKLLEGFDTRFWPEFGDDLTALGMRQKYAQYHYAAHWIMPSPEQMKEFLYRTEEIAAATGKGFAVEDFKRILAEQDYNPLAREWFAATAYNVPAISYVKEWYRQGIIDKKDLQKYHRWLGFNPKDAENFAAIDDLQKVRTRAAQTHGWTTKAASDAWVTGQIDTPRHEQVYVNLGYTPLEAAEARDAADASIGVKIMTRSRSKALTTIASTVTTALNVGVMTEQQASAALQSVGWPKEFAAGYVATQNAAAGVKIVQTGISFLRRRVLDGSIDFPAAQQELVRFGLTPQAIARYLSVWRLMQTPRRKHRTAQQISSDVAAGHMSKQEATARLTNLGYDDADTRLYLADAQAKLVKLNTARQAAADKKGMQRVKALKQAQKDAQKLHDQLGKSLLHEIPWATLKKWAKLGIIGKDFFVERAKLYGYAPADIERYYTEACSAKGAACVDTTPPNPPTS